ARRHHRPRDERGGRPIRGSVGSRSRRRPRPDRRRDRRTHHRESDCDGARYAARRGEPSRGARTDAAADGRLGVPLLPVPGVSRLASLQDSLQDSLQYPLQDQDVRDLCASFQAAVLDSTADRLSVGLKLFKARFGVPQALVAAGGVAANQAIRAALQAVAEAAQTTLIMPPPALCTDNGAMIAWAGAERLALGMIDGMD